MTNLQKSEAVSGKLSATLLAVSMLTIMVGSVLAPALPEIATKLGMVTYPSLLITLPALGVIISAPLVSIALDKFGGKSTLIVGLLLYGGLGLLGAWLQSAPLIIADRLLLGVATAFIMASGTNLIAENYTGELRLKMIARQGMSIEIGGIIFLSISGLLANIFWKLPFALYIVAWLYILPVLAYVPKSRELRSEVLAKYLTGKFNGEWSIFLIATASMLSFFAAFITLPHMMSRAEYTETEIGFYLGAISSIAVFTAGILPKLRGRFSPNTIFILAFASYGIAHALFAMDISILKLAVAGVFAGAGFGLTIPLCNYEILNKSSKSNRNKNLALLSSAIFLGQILSSLCEIFEISMRLTFSIMIGLAILVIIGLCLSRIRRGSSLRAQSF